MQDSLSLIKLEQLVRSSFGPFSSFKALVDSTGKIRITANIGSIVQFSQNLDQDPILKIILKQCGELSSKIGDGTGLLLKLFMESYRQVLHSNALKSCKWLN